MDDLQVSEEIDDYTSTPMDRTSFNLLNNLKFDDLKTIGNLFKKRLTHIGKTVVSNRLWLKSVPPSSCMLLVTFSNKTPHDALRELLNYILNENLNVNIKYHSSTKEIAFYVSATYERLLKGAEDIQLKKPIKSNLGGGFKEFIFEEQEFYKNIENELIFLTTQEKQTILLDILYSIKTDDKIQIGNIQIPPNGKIIFWCEHKKLISQILPIHDQSDLKDLRSKWVKSTRTQPLDKIRSYFGVKIAIYFAWLGFYTRALLLPAILGVFMWLSEFEGTSYSPLYFIVLCAFNLIWGTCFNNLWKQRSAEYSFKWRTLDMQEKYLQEPRPLFKGEYRISKVTNRMEAHYAEWKRACFRYMLTLPMLILTIVLTVCLMITMFQFQNYVNHLTKESLVPRFFGLTVFLPKMIYAKCISRLNKFYKRVCVWLNDKENFREATTHENQLIAKIVSFQFINSYLSLFYIAFYLQDKNLLKEHLFAFFISKQLSGNLKESIIPYISENYRIIELIKRTKINEDQQVDDDLMNKLKNLQEYASRVGNKDAHDMEHDILKSKTSKDGLSQPEMESIMPKYPDTFEDFLEIVIQYGLLIFFSPSFPLAALFALINNIFEIRSDAFKMCYLYQRPFGQEVPDIGMWQDVIKVFTSLGIIVNCTQLVTFDIMKSVLPNQSKYEIVVLIIVIEHILLVFNQFLNYSIPKLPKWIIIEKCKLEFKRREALRQLETSEMHKLQERNSNSGSSN